ncbi:putative ribonuclease H-like domain-containing protein [Tanacetum coccineum]
MDVKSAFLYGKIEEEVYVCQPPGFEDPHFPDKVYKVEKALYGLHQAPRAWYETLSTYLLDNGFHKGQIDKMLFIKRHKDDILLVQVYVEDIIFGSTKKEMSTEFEKLMHDKFQMSYIGELSFFLRLQTVNTPMETNKALIKDEEAEDVDVYLYRSMIGSLMYLTASRLDIMFAVCACARDSPFNLEAFSDSDYARASLDKKSTTGAQYVAAANCCGHVLWIQNQMLDYGFNFMNTKIYIDNESTICIMKNLVFHSKTKYIKIRHHFIRDSYEKKLIQVIKIHTDQNVADLLTKAFDASRVKTAKAKHIEYLVGDEAVHKELGDRMERAATTASSLEAEQDSGSGPRVVAVEEDLKQTKKGYSTAVTKLILKLFKDEQAKAMAEQEQERINFEVALELQRLYSVAEVRKNIVMYLKNQGGYKMSYFKGMKYEDIRPIFEKVWDQIQSFAPIDSEKEKDSEKKP